MLIAQQLITQKLLANESAVSQLAPPLPRSVLGRNTETQQQKHSPQGFAIRVIIIHTVDDGRCLLCDCDQNVTWGTFTHRIFTFSLRIYISGAQLHRATLILKYRFENKSQSF